MKKILTAFRFMTIIPVPGGSHADLSEAGKSAVFFPLVGLLLGGILVLTVLLSELFWSAIAVSAAVTAVWVVLTAGMHIDGLADLADGLGGGWDVESRLRIMKDSSVGTYGALAVGILLLMKTVLLYELINDTASGSGRQLLFSSLVFIPAAGRGMQVLSIRIFPPAKKEGFGAVFKAGVTVPAAVTAALAVVAAATGFWGLSGAAVSGAAFLFMLAAGKWISLRLGGLNGDAYGAVCELAELFVLAALTIMRPEFSGWLNQLFIK